MTYNDLVADADLMRSIANRYLNSNGRDYTDTELKALKKNGAKIIMKNDLNEALIIDQEDTTTLDSCIDLNSVNLSVALSYLQLALYFQENDEGDDSVGRYMYKENMQRYFKMKSKFAYLMKRNNTASYNTTGNITIG